MLDWLWLVKWLLIATAAAPMVIGICWAVIEREVLPRLVSRAEIEAMAEAVMRHHPDDPEGWALMEEHAAWYRSLSFQQGKWRRVGNMIRQRLLAGDLPPSATKPAPTRGGSPRGGRQDTEQTREWEAGQRPARSR